MLKSWMEKGAKWGAAGPAGPAGLVLAPNKLNCQLQRVPASLLSSQRLQPHSSGGHGGREEGRWRRMRKKRRGKKGEGIIEGVEGGDGGVGGDVGGEGNRRGG